MEAIAKDYANASTSSSSAVSCLLLRFTTSLFYSSVGWTWTSMAIAPKGLRTEASCNQLLLILVHMYMLKISFRYTPFCQCTVIIRNTRISMQNICNPQPSNIIHSCTGLAHHTMPSFVRLIHECTLYIPSPPVEGRAFACLLLCSGLLKLDLHVDLHMITI